MHAERIPIPQSHPSPTGFAAAIGAVEMEVARTSREDQILGRTLRLDGIPSVAFAIHLEAELASGSCSLAAKRKSLLQIAKMAVMGMQAIDSEILGEDFLAQDELEAHLLLATA